MAPSWCPGMVEASRELRRVNGQLQLPELSAAIDAQIAETIAPDAQDV